MAPRNFRRRNIILVTAMFLVIAAFAVWAIPNRQISAAKRAIASRRFDLARHRLDGYPSWGFEPQMVTFLHARINRLIGDSQAANRSLDQAEADGFDADAVARERNLIAAQNGDVIRLNDKLDRYLRDAPSDRSAIMEAFTVGYLGMARVDEAQTLIDFWIADDQPDARAHYWKGVLEDLKRNPDAALDQYAIAAQIDPDMIDAVIRQAERSVEQDRLDDSLVCYHNANTAMPDRIDIRLSIADVLWRMDRRSEAIEWYADIAKEDARIYRAASRLGEYFTADRNAAKVVEFVTPALTHYPDDVAMNSQLAIALDELGQREASRERLECFISGNAALDRLRYEATDTHRLGDYRELIRIADAYVRFDWPESQTWLLRAIRAQPQRADAYQRIAEFHRRGGSRIEAAQQQRIADSLRQKNQSH